MRVAGPLGVQGVVGDQRRRPRRPMAVPFLAQGIGPSGPEPTRSGGGHHHRERHPKTAKATNAATATATSAGWPRARPPTRTTAWATIASTAGASPAKTAVTRVVSPAT